MIKIISDVEVVQQKAGFRFTEKLLQATQSHDRRPTIPVLLVLEDGTELLMVREIEKGNMLQVNCKLPVVFYHPYFLLDNKTRDMVPPSLAAAIKTRAEASKICCDEGLVYAVYEQLTQHFSVEMIGRGRFVQGQVYRTSCQEVVSRFYTNQSSVDKAAFALTERMANGSRIREMLGQGGSDTRFTSLTELMAKEGLDAVVASSPLAVMELAGYPACGIGAPELLAIYQQGENEVIVFTPCSRTGQELEELGFRPAGQMSLVELLKDKRVGFEEDSLDVATYLLLAESCELKKASGLLRLWRESKLGSKDLAYFVLTASASKYAVEKTMAYAADKVRQQENLTEADLYRLYQDLVQKFVREEQIPVPIEIYFTNLHAGIRSPYPAVPSNHPVNRDGKTHKMDAGLMVLDGPRLMHA
ncbi:MAG: hypothetical protein GX062_00295, partial [Firmicutes bacterium]|nr:hypothetical protein [Bacillota bacterium]